MSGFLYVLALLVALFGLVVLVFEQAFALAGGCLSVAVAFAWMGVVLSRLTSIVQNTTPGGAAPPKARGR